MTSSLNLDETDIVNDYVDSKCATSFDVDTFLNMNHNDEYDDEDYSETEYYSTRTKPRMNMFTRNKENSRTSKSSLNKLINENNQTIEQCINDKSEMSKDDLNKIYSELNLIHHKLMVISSNIPYRHIYLKK
jgi:hypothetical protein